MSTIDNVMAGLDTKLRKFKQEYGIEFMARVKEKTPVASGVLQGSWGFEMKAEDISIYNVAEYAEFVENGTPKMAPRGMLRATMQEAEDIARVAAEKAGLKSGPPSSGGEK